MSFYQNDLMHTYELQTQNFSMKRPTMNEELDRATMKGKCKTLTSLFSDLYKSYSKLSPFFGALEQANLG